MRCVDFETEIPRRMLGAVLAAVKGPACLMGGWAVHLAVNAGYRESTGRDYVGSKDIDVGFHLGDRASGSIGRSPYAESIGALEQMGFYNVSFRMLRSYHRETGRALSRDEEKKVPEYDLFRLYVDPIVDSVPDGFAEALGFRPIDEPLLRAVFEGGRRDEIEAFGARFAVPKPDVLLAAKVASLPGRDKEYKRHKDIADVYALIWHSGQEPGDLKSDVLRHVPDARIKGALRAVSEEEYEKTAGMLGVPARALKGALDLFARA